MSTDDTADTFSPLCLADTTKLGILKTRKILELLLELRQIRIAYVSQGGITYFALEYHPPESSEPPMLPPTQPLPTPPPTQPLPARPLPADTEVGDIFVNLNTNDVYRVNRVQMNPEVELRSLGLHTTMHYPPNDPRWKNYRRIWKPRKD
jgi:hypothetical protein